MKKAKPEQRTQTHSMRLAIIGCFALGIAACGWDLQTSSVDVGSAILAKATACAGVPSGTSSLKIAPSIALTVGIGATMDYIVTNQAGVIVPDCALSWSTSNGKIATVSSTGLATGKALGGPITIKAQTSGKAALTTSAMLSVGTTVVSISITPSNMDLVLGTSTKLTATITDTKGNTVTNRYITWASSDAAKGIVSTDGTVTALATGTFTVSATVEGKSASSTIQVTNPLASDGWVYWATNRHYYKFFGGTPTWDDARLQAAAITVPGFSAQLASLATTGAQGFIINYLNTLNIQTPGKYYIWFGLFQNTSSPLFAEPAGGWEWLSGEPLDKTSIWAAGEPNNATIIGTENCAAMAWYPDSPSFNGTFVDYPCIDPYGYFSGYVVELTPRP